MTADDPEAPRVAIVDYGMGNLFSVRRACEQSGMRAEVTAERSAILAADGVILPGVGAFGDAMAALERLDLTGPLRDVADSPRLLVGICLGLQLMMTESEEFGGHAGLGLLEGPVVRLENPGLDGEAIKVPHVGWNRIHPSGAEAGGGTVDAWNGTPLETIPAGTYMYFVHSYYARPADPGAVLSMTRYGGRWFCSGLRRRNLVAFQFHPERSGPDGLRVYGNLAAMLRGRSRVGEGRRG